MSTYWILINTFSIPIGIYLLRNGFVWFKAWRASYEQRKQGIRRLTRRTAFALNLIFITALTGLGSSLPYFSAPNLFVETNSRVQTSTEVIFNRLSDLRNLTALDLALKPKLGSKDGRLLYFFLPALLTPHILHLIVLGLATSGPAHHNSCARWRNTAIVTAAVLALIELWMTFTYELTANTRALRPEEIDFFYWKMQIGRGISMAFLDAVLGLVMWLSATNRLFAEQPSFLDRIGQISRVVEQNQGRLNATGNVRNTIVRDEVLRERLGQYWSDEKDIYEEREVVDGIKGALTRIDMQNISNMAVRRADEVVGSLQPQQVINK